MQEHTACGRTLPPTADALVRRPTSGPCSVTRGFAGEEAQISGIKEAQNIGMGLGFITSFAKLGTPDRVRKRLSRMRVAVVAGVLSAGLLASVPSHAQSASSWNKRGQAAELRQDYDAAYEAYLHAHQKNPKDLRYTTRVDRMRFQAAASHVDRGRLLRQSGDINGALAEFTRALQIDPADEAAAQEIQVTQHPQMMAPISGGPGGSATNAAPPGGTAGPTIPEADPMHDLGEVTSPVVLKPLSDDPITMHIVEDTKVIYQAIGKAAGLNILFDPDYTSKRIPVDLNRVSLPDALRIVGLVSKTFYKAVTPDTIYVATNERQNHTNIDDLAVQTFFLSNVSQPNDGNEIQTAVRNLRPADTAKM
ncbi:MAG: hypothetical protein NVS9B15_15340 [Acidobacteriaceae bacterium]